MNNKKADAKHPHRLTPPKWKGKAMNRFALLTVRRMFSLLYYLGILPLFFGKVKNFFAFFLHRPGISYAKAG